MMLKKLLSLSLCAVMVCALSVTALAEGAEEGTPESEEKTLTIATTVQKWGTVTKMESGSILLKNETQGDIILHISENTLILDAVSGNPVAYKDLKDGSTVYAQTSPIMALSMPPQSTAVVIFCNLPADFRAPTYYQVVSSAMNQDGSATVMTDQGDMLTVPAECTFTPYLTKNIVSVHDLRPGANIIAWFGSLAISANVPQKIMVLPYAYRSWVEVTEQSVVLEGDMVLPGAPIVSEKENQMIPLRAICEAVGLTVTWQAPSTVVVTNGDVEVFSLVIGEDTATMGEDKVYLAEAAYAVDGVTYVDVRNVARLVNLYLKY